MDHSADFKLTPEQERFLESEGRFVWRGGRVRGRRRATEALIVVQAATSEDARLCLEDLERDGVALQDSAGKRVAPPKSKPPRVVFDEAPLASS